MNSLPLLPSNKQTSQAPSLANTASLSEADLKLLSELLASSEELPDTAGAASPVKMPVASGDMWQARLPNFSNNPICKQDGQCGACSTEDELLA